MSIARAKLSLKARAMQWLAMREHSRLELRRKLLAQLSKERRQQQQLDRAADVPVDEDSYADAQAEAIKAVEALLDELATLGHLSDQRFVESRLRTRVARHGNQRIRAELSQHGLTMDQSQSDTLRDSECLRAYELWRRRFGGDVATERDSRLKQMRFLASRGFSADVIRRVVEGGFVPSQEGA